jgi:PQQ-dependent catabolism-associated CXXCW motif protein
MIARAAVVLALLVAVPTFAQEKPAEPAGYRLDDYRSPVPATLTGAKALTTEQAAALLREGSAVFVDVLPRPPKPAGLPPSAVWRDKPRHDIPGSIWLPDTGFGALSDATLRYFRNGLARATAGDARRLLVFYCLANCWMSWNAAKRALSLGHTNVAWYPEGADGWEKAGHRLEPREPEPRGD